MRIRKERLALRSLICSGVSGRYAHLNLRPSNSKINHLKEENAKLRKLVEKLQPQSDVDRAPLCSESQPIEVLEISKSISSGGDVVFGEKPDGAQGTARGQNISSSISSATEVKAIEDSQSIQFHGPSSAMFDENNPCKRRKMTSDVRVDASKKTQLLAEAAKQRMLPALLLRHCPHILRHLTNSSRSGQLELINFRSGKLDFDGVEPEIAMDLLSVFWNRQHASGSVVYRPSFMRDMVNRGRYFSPLLLNAIYFVASKHTPKLAGSCSLTENCMAGTPFRRKIEDIIYRTDPQILCRSSITTVQSLLLVSDALFSWCDERSLSHHYLGIAINMIIDMGLHTENASPASGRSHSSEELEIRRRAFWAAFGRRQPCSVI